MGDGTVALIFFTDMGVAGSYLMSIFIGRDCCTDRCMLLLKLRGRFSVSVAGTGKFVLEMLDVEDLNEVEIKEESWSLEELCGFGEVGGEIGSWQRYRYPEIVE